MKKDDIQDFLKKHPNAEINIYDETGKILRTYWGSVLTGWRLVEVKNPE